MFEPLHFQVIIAGDVTVRPDYNRNEALSTPKALLWRATSLAIESAFRFGADLPVGATIGNDSEQIAGVFASDNRTGVDELHAERYALYKSEMYGFIPKMLGVTMEPCSPCQNAISSNSVEDCYFVLSREQVSDLGLVNSRPGLLDGPIETESPYYTQVSDPLLTDINLAILSNVHRNSDSGNVVVDTEKLMNDLCEFDQITPFVH